MEWLVVVESEGDRSAPFASRLATSAVRVAIWAPSDGNSPPSHDAILLPSLSLVSLARLACLLWDTPLTSLVGNALLAGRPVAFFRSGVRPPGDLVKEMPAGVRKVVDEYCERLERFGMIAATEETWLQGKTGRGGGSRKRPVITEEDIRELRAKGEKVVRLEAGSIVTPLARDAARELGIELVEMREDNGAPA